MVKESKNFNIEQDQKQTQKLNSKETSNEDQKHSKKIKKQKYKRPQKEKNIYIDNSSKIEEAFNNNKFISNDIRKKSEVFDLSNLKSRKNSKDSEEYSTSNEDNQKKEKMKEKKNQKKSKKNNKFSKKDKKEKEPYRTNAFDFKKKYKTELCKNFEINGYCKYGDNCAYAHGIENLRLKITNTTAYRTKKCIQFFEKGYCPYGNRCQFAHQLESNIINNPYDKKMTYSKILETFSKIEKIENIKNIVEKPRLQVFKDFVKNDENIPSRLLYDFKNLACNENTYY